MEKLKLRRFETREFRKKSFSFNMTKTPSPMK